METKGLKALADKVLKRNRQGNFKETLSFHEGNFEGKKEPKVSNEFPRSFQTVFCYWQGADVPASECIKPCSSWQGQGMGEVALKVSECPHFRAYWHQRVKELQGTGRHEA